MSNAYVKSLLTEQLPLDSILPHGTGEGETVDELAQHWLSLKVPAIDVDSSPEELEKEAELRADASGSVASCSKRKSEGTNDAEAAAKSKRPKTWNHMLLHNRIQATRA